jgi:hypothetical protein
VSRPTERTETLRTHRSIIQILNQADLARHNSRDVSFIVAADAYRDSCRPKAATRSARGSESRPLVA